MKRIVQRFALALLLMLPMLANAQLNTTASAKYGTARGTVVVKGHNATDYDTVVAVVKSGYQIVDDQSWYINSTRTTPGTTPGTSPWVEAPTAGTEWLILDKNSTWTVLVNFLPTTPQVIFTATNGSVLDHGVTPIASGVTYAYGTHVYLKAVPNTSYSFGGWLESDALNAAVIASSADIDFYIFDDTTFYPSFDPAQYKITLVLEPQNASPLVAAFEYIEFDDGMNYTPYSGADLTAPIEFTLPYDQPFELFATTNNTYYDNSHVEWKINGSTVATDYYYAVTFPRTCDTTITITAVPNNFTVTIDNDDDYFGYVDPAGDRSWAYGDTQTIHAYVNDPSFKFVKWMRGSDSLSNATEYDYLVTGTATVTAYWDYKSFPITLTAATTGTGTFKVDNVAYDSEAEYTFGTDHTIKAFPADGYHFVQWSDNGSTNPERSITIATTNSYTAEFATESYTVSFADNGYTGKLTLEGDGTYDYGTGVELTATELHNDQYVFDGWQINGGSTIITNPYTFTLESNTTVTALYHAVEYNVTIAEGNGTTDPANGVVAYGSDFTITAATLAGREFNHWELGGINVSSNTPETFTLNTAGDREYTAVYDNNSYAVNVTVVPDVAGTVTGSGNHEYSSSVTLHATPNTHFEFIGWDGGSDPADLSFTMPANAVNHTATFDTIAYPVTVTAGEHGSIDIASGNMKYGKEVVFTATADADWHVDAWTITGAVDYTVSDLSVAGDKRVATVKIGENTSVAVAFEHDPVTITLTTDPVALDDPSLANPTFTPTTPVYGQEIALSYTAVEGYTFTGWKKGSTDVADPAHVTVDGDATYTAYFTKNTYTISVAQTPNDGSMGTVTIDGGTSKLMEHGDMVGALIDTQAVAGYELIGWTDGNGAEITDINAYTATKAETLTAVFNYATLNVTATAVDSVTVAGGAGVNLVTEYSPVFTITGFKILGGVIQTTAPEITGWHFKGWLNETYADKAIANPRKDTLTSFDPVTYTAIYAIDSFTVTITPVAGVTFTGAGRVPYNGSATIDYTIANTDSLAFAHWGDNNTEHPRTVTAITSNRSFAPVFNVKEYTVTAANDGNGTAAVAVATVPYHQQASLSATPNYGYVFDHWDSAGVATTYTTATLTPRVHNDVTWTANFTEKTVALAADVKDLAGTAEATAGDMGTVTGTGNFLYGSVHTLSQSAADGFTFKKWVNVAGDEFTSATLDVTMSGSDTTITAVFDTNKYDLTVVSEDDNKGTVTGTTNIQWGRSVQITATEKTGYQFKEWNDHVTDATRTVTVPKGGATYTASFEPRQYTITVAAGEHGSVEIVGQTELSVTDDFGASYTIKATPATGYHFDSWTDGGAAEHAVTIPAADNTTYTASFAANTYALTLTSNNVYYGGVRFAEADPSAATVSNAAVAFGSEVRIEAVPEYGHVLESWSDGDTHKVRQYVYNTADDVELTATFVKRPYDLTVTLTNSADYGTITINGNAAQSGVAVPVEYTTRPHIVITPIAHYHIYNAANPAAPFDNTHPLELDTTVLSDISLEYTIVPDSFHVVINVDDPLKGTIIGLDPTTFDINYNATISGVKARAIAPNHFVNWSNGATDSILPNVVVISDTTITANFSINTYDLTVSSEDNEKGTVTGSLTNVTHGTSVTVTATPETGYEFDKWTDDRNENAVVAGAGASYTFTLDSTTALTAHFKNETYDLTLSTFTPERGWISVAYGNVYESDETGANFTVNDLPTHTNITVTAHANTGYHFDYWEDDADPSNPTIPAERTIQMTADNSLTARFAYDVYTVDVAANMAVRGDIDILGTWATHFGAVDTILAVPAAGYIFQKWENGSTANPRYYSVTGNATGDDGLVAIFIYDTTERKDTVCDSFEWNNVTYTNSDVAIHTYTDVFGFDSIVVDTITINHSSNTAYAPAAACDELNYTWVHFDDPAMADTTILTSGVYYHHYTSAEGCPSVDTLTVTINANTSHNFGDVDACDVYTMTWTDNATEDITTNGIQTHDYLTNEGCPSTDTVNVTIKLSSVGTDVQHDICDSYQWIDGETYTADNNTATKVLTNAAGCDSTVTLDLTIVHNSGTTRAPQVACDELNYTWEADNQPEVFTVSDTYYHDYTDVNGCASTDTVVVTINQHQDSQSDVAICDSYLWTVNGETYTESGVYTAPITDANNCVATATLNLTINHSTGVMFEVTECDTYTWTIGSNSNTYTSSGVYTFGYINSSNCYQVDTLDLTINYSANTVDVQEACDSYLWPANNTTYTASNNTAVANLQTVNSCDSTVTLNLTINYNSNTTRAAQVACDQLNYTWEADGQTQLFTTSGTYTHDYVNAAGCPSTDQVKVTIYQHEDIVATKVACDSYDWTVSGETYTESGIYTLDITDGNNCDATATLNLTINESNTGIDEQHACNAFTWIDNVTYTESNNTATKTLTNAAGCDSVVTLNLTVTYSQEVEVYDSGCESYEWNGLTFTTSRDVVYTTTDQFGCDSVTTLHLTINQPTAGEFTDSAYGMYIWNGETYQTDGDYQQTLTDGNGCDSVVTLHLTILLPDNPFLYDTACVSYTWELNGMTYTESGIYNDTIRSLVNDEDSIITTLFLLINEPVNPEPVDIASCGSYTWHGTVYDVEGTYTFDTIDAHNCAITETINLTINTAVDPAAVEAVACESYTWHGTVYTASGVQTFDTVDANGCAIVETLNLTINPVKNEVLPEVVACDSYEWNGETYTTEGTLTYTTTGVNGCDSITTVNLWLNHGSYTHESAEACVNFEWKGQTYTASGVYTYEYLNVDECPSVDTLYLTVNQPKTVALDAVTVCDSYEWNGQTYTASQELSVTVPGVNGCDSTTTLALTINAHQDTLESAAACETYTWTVNNQTYTASGTYTAAITDANGCPATATLNLTINEPADTTVTVTACDSYTWTANNQTYTTGGTYTAAITDVNGCAATATLNLTVNQHQDSQVSASACDTYTWNNQTYTTSGTYTSAITDANGCAATVTLTLTVNQSVTNAIALTDTGSVVWNGTTYTESTVVTVTFDAANGCDSTVTATITVIPEVVVPDSIFVYIGVNYPAHGTVNPSTYANYAIGETVTATATADSGYQFAYWVIGRFNAAGTSYDTVYTNPISYVITADDTNYSMLAIAATFESISGVVDSMTITLATADATMGTTNPAPGTYRLADGDSLIFTAVANTGYQFLYWIRETQYTTGGQSYIDTLDGVSRQVDALTWLLGTTATYTAYFQVDTNYVPDTVYHYVTLMSSNITMGSVSASGSVIDGENFTATATANEGYHFVSWTNGGLQMSTDNPYTFPVYADITLTANFAADPIDTVYYNVTVNYDTTMGTVTGDGRYIEGTIVTLRATANTGYHFTGWYDANNQLLAATYEYTFTVTADMTFNAMFEADAVQYIVNAEPNDVVMGYVQGAGPYEAGATVNLSAYANEGYRFVRWSNGETTPTISFTVTCDTSFIAYFEAEPQSVDEADMSNVTIYSADSRIIILGAEGKDVNVYDINGRTISSKVNAGEAVEFRMATTGVYLVKVGNAPAKRVLVVR